MRESIDRCIISLRNPYSFIQKSINSSSIWRPMQAAPMTRVMGRMGTASDVPDATRGDDDLRIILPGLLLKIQGHLHAAVSSRLPSCTSPHIVYPSTFDGASDDTAFHP